MLRGEARLELRREAVASSVRRSRGAKAAADRSGTGRAAAGSFESAEDEALWAALRGLRTELARAQNVPPYVVFHDATLAEMVRRRPQTLDELGAVSGIGERKLAAFGEQFLAAIRGPVL